MRLGRISLVTPSLLGDETVFLTVLLDQSVEEQASGAPPTHRETSLERVVPIEGDVPSTVGSPAGTSAEDDASHLAEAEPTWEEMLSDDRVPPTVREHLLNIPQRRFIVGDVKTLLLLESAITKALKASVTEDKAHRKQLLRFCQVMSSFGIMHGELHLFFHCLQAIFQLWFGLLLQPAAALLRRSGIEPKKGPIDKFAHHLNHLDQTIAAVMTAMYFRLIEQRGVPADLVTFGGGLDAQVLTRWIETFLADLDANVDQAIFVEFCRVSTEFLTAYPAGRGHVTTFVDVISKEFLPMFKLLGKGGYVWASMRATEQTEMELSPYLQMIWSLQRTFGKRHLAAYLDEHVEDLNWWVKLLAVNRGQMVRYGRLASRVQATTRSFDLMKRGKGDDPGHRVGSRDQDHNELVHWLMACGVGDITADANMSCKEFAPVIRLLANPPTDMALLLGLPGSLAVVDDDTQRKAVVVRAEHDFTGGGRNAMRIVLECLDDNQVFKVESGSVDVSVARDYAAAALRSAENAERTQQDTVDHLREVAEEIDTLAGTVEIKHDFGGRIVTCNLGEVPSLLNQDWEADPTPPLRVEKEDHIAHYFDGADCGWSVGVVKSVGKDGTFYYGYTSCQTSYPHRLEKPS
jgi:hypothetical protein